ncbi:MAG: cupin domain-containing protein [Spirochaetaceae bacterium]|jgi:mannose-6-phosphate isomerase-like protein (cupin superfamily)|nr:cupin domain-containing protein [Spirochaetaceae bacterium]
MVFHREELAVEQKEKARGGEGTAHFVHFVEGKGKVQKNTNLLAEITLPPGASIGKHVHTGEAEFFIIMEGSGVVDDNGKEIPIKKGDVMVTVSGDSHSIANNGQVPLVLHAVIISG